MNTITTNLILAITMLLITSCELTSTYPEKNEREKLPLATQEGKDFLAYLINDKAVFKEDGFPQAVFGSPNANFISAGNKDDKRSYGISIHFAENEFVPELDKAYDLTNESLITFYFDIKYANQEGEVELIQYTNEQLETGEIKFTAIGNNQDDRGYVAGIFHFTLKNEDGTTEKISDGRFDLLMYYQ